MKTLQSIKNLIEKVKNDNFDKELVLSELIQIKNDYKSTYYEYGVNGEKVSEIWKFVPDAIAISDENGIVLDCNSAYLNLYETTQKHVIGKSFSEIFPNEKRKAAEDRYKKVFKLKNSLESYESWVITHNGKKKYVQSLTKFIRNDKNELLLLSIVRDLTQRKLNEDKLSHLNERLDIVLNASQVGTWLLDLENNESVVNDNWIRMLGFEPDEMQDPLNYFQNNIHPDDKYIMDDILSKKEKPENEFLNYEIRVKTKSGKWKWILDKGKILNRSKDGLPKRIAGVHIDIDDRKKAQLSFIKSRERFKFLFDSLPYVLWTANEDGSITEVNKAGLKYFGRDESELIKDGWIPVLHENDKEKVIRKWENSVNFGSDFESYQRMQAADGNYNWFHVNAYLYNFNNEKTWFGISRNVNERFQLTSRLELIANNSNDILSLFIDHRLEYATPNSEKILGYKVDELDLKTLFSTIHSDDKKKIIKFYKNWVANKKADSHNLIYKAVKKDGTVIWLESRIIDRINSDENLVSIVSSRDITERVKYEIELKKANSFKRKLLSVITHDLSSSIGSVMGLSTLMIQENKDKFDFETLYIMKKINESVNSSYELLNNILNWAKKADEENRNPNIVIKLNQVIKKIIDFHIISIEDKNIKIINHIPEQTYLKADNTMLETVIRNLLSNAIKFSFENSEIEFGIEREVANNITFYIKDQGIGIEEEYIDKLFDSDFDKNLIGQSTSKGTGLGLQITSEFIKQMNGEIFVESEKDKGSKFLITMNKA